MSPVVVVMSGLVEFCVVVKEGGVVVGSTSSGAAGGLQLGSMQELKVVDGDGVVVVDDVDVVVESSFCKEFPSLFKLRSTYACSYQIQI